MWQLIATSMIPRQFIIVPTTPCVLYRTSLWQRTTHNHQNGFTLQGQHEYRYLGRGLYQHNNFDAIACNAITQHSISRDSIIVKITKRSIVSYIALSKYLLSPFHIKVPVTMERWCSTFAHGYFEWIPLYTIPTYSRCGSRINCHKGVHNPRFEIRLGKH